MNLQDQIDQIMSENPPTCNTSLKKNLDAIRVLLEPVLIALGCDRFLTPRYEIAMISTEYGVDGLLLGLRDKHLSPVLKTDVQLHLPKSVLEAKDPVMSAQVHRLGEHIKKVKLDLYQREQRIKDMIKETQQLEQEMETAKDVYNKLSAKYNQQEKV